MYLAPLVSNISMTKTFRRDIFLGIFFIAKVITKSLVTDFMCEAFWTQGMTNDNLAFYKQDFGISTPK